MKLYKEGRADRDGRAATASRIMKDHRNRLKGIGLSWGMRFLLTLAFVLIPMQAMSLKDFNAKPGNEQAVYVVDFIENMTSDLGAKNPQLARDIRDWFSKHPAGKPISAGMERLYVELGALDIQAKDGRADLSKIQIESIIIYLAKQKFPPQVVTPITPARKP